MYVTTWTCLYVLFWAIATLKSKSAFGYVCKHSFLTKNSWIFSMAFYTITKPFNFIFIHLKLFLCNQTYNMRTVIEALQWRPALRLKQSVALCVNEVFGMANIISCKEGILQGPDVLREAGLFQSLRPTSAPFFPAAHPCMWRHPV